MSADAGVGRVRMVGSGRRASCSRQNTPRHSQPATAAAVGRVPPRWGSGSGGGGGDRDPVPAGRARRPARRRCRRLGRGRVAMFRFRPRDRRRGREARRSWLRGRVVRPVPGDVEHGLPLVGVVEVFGGPPVEVGVDVAAGGEGDGPGVDQHGRHRERTRSRFRSRFRSRRPNFQRLLGPGIGPGFGPDPRSDPISGYVVLMAGLAHHDLLGAKHGDGPLTGEDPVLARSAPARVPVRHHHLRRRGGGERGLGVGDDLLGGRRVIGGIRSVGG